MNLVQVQFESRYKPGTFAGGAYTYIADHPLEVDDIVEVSTKYGESLAKVCCVGVPISEIHCRVGELKHITKPATAGNLLAGFM